MGSEPIFIGDGAEYDLNQFKVPKKYIEDVSSIMIPSGLINNRIEKLAEEVNEEYTNKNLHLLCVLKGGLQFFSDLMHFLEYYNESFGYDFIQLSSYKGDKSTGKLKTIPGSNLENITNKNLLIVEDIVDTAQTMAGKNYVEGEKIIGGLIEMVDNYNPSSVKVISLLLKRTDKSNGYKPDFAGFSIPDKFVVGYGLDYNENLRGVPHICVISDSAKKKYEIKK